MNEKTKAAFQAFVNALGEQLQNDGRYELVDQAVEFLSKEFDPQAPNFGLPT